MRACEVLCAGKSSATSALRQRRKWDAAGQASRVLSPLNTLLLLLPDSGLSPQNNKWRTRRDAGTEYLEPLQRADTLEPAGPVSLAAIRNQQPMTKDSRKTLTRSTFNQTRQRQSQPDKWNLRI
jgi:hypothetical protein